MLKGDKMKKQTIFLLAMGAYVLLLASFLVLVQTTGTSHIFTFTA